jgi:hypothetical protein
MRAGLIVMLFMTLLTACRTSPATTATTRSRPGGTPALAPTDVSLGPDINPLTGLRVADPSLLKVPALLISISHFPATARPQSGLSFAPFVYEFYITEGATRFLAVFYGEKPLPEVPVKGGCETRTGPFVQSGLILGNRVWDDANGNGLQDAGEGGISGLCVNLYDVHGHLLQRASTDSNGYHGFNVQPGRYTVEFEKLHGYHFTKPNAGDGSADSNADPASGRAGTEVSADDLSVDAGLVPTGNAPTPPPDSMPVPQIGPVRSGRLLYRYLAQSYGNSCLVYAFASEEVLKHLPQCHMVFHQLVAGGYMMGLDEMQEVAQQNLEAKGSDFNYATNVFSQAAPTGGTPASLLKVYFAYQNQSGWAYDPLSQSYLRYVDTSEFDQAGVLHADTDRLTGRQLAVQNLIVLYAEHDVVSPTNLDIHLDKGAHGKAVLFRNGQMFSITWSNRVQPIQFLQQDGKPVALEPGHTWVLIVTPDSKLEESNPGQWQLIFAQPPGAG